MRLDLYRFVLPGWLAGSILFLLTFLVYVKTLAPGVYGFDSAELVTGVYTQGLIHPPGYPVYLLLGKLFTFLPFGNVAYRLNLMSAFFASITVLLLYWVIVQIVKNRFAAWSAALMFAVSNYFWQMALIAEVYTLHTAFLACNLLVLNLWCNTGMKKYLLWYSFLYGLALAVHTSGILYAPAFIWLILRSPAWNKSCWLWVGPMFLLFLLGLSPYAYLSLRAGADPLIDYSAVYSGVDLTTLSGLWWLISGRAYAIFAFGYGAHEVVGEFLLFTAYLWRNFLGAGVILGLAGIVVLWRENFRWALGLILLFSGNMLFFVNYRVLDKDTMFLPAYTIFAIFMAAGLDVMERQIRKMISIGLFESWVQVMERVLVVLVIALGLSLNWRWVDMSSADGYSLFARETMASAASNSIIIASWSPAVVLEYHQVVEGMRPDLLIVNRSRINVARYYELWQLGFSREEILTRIEEEEKNLISGYIRQKTIYAVEYDSVLASNFEYLPKGAFFRLALP